MLLLGIENDGRTENMRKNFVTKVVLTVGWLLVSATSGFADSVYVKGDTVLLADDNLFIYSIDNDQFPLEEIIVGGATDVTVSGCKAVVTAGSDSKEIVVVDLSENESVDPGFCKKCGEVTYDPEESVLSVPCVEALGKVYTVDMKQRGNSDNWYIKFIAEVEDDDDDDDDDDDEDEDD
jgi:hypothetical protein